LLPHLPSLFSADICDLPDELGISEEHAGQPVAPVLEESDSLTEIEALIKELKALHAENPVSWEPTCPAEQRDQSDYITWFKAFVKCVAFDEDFFDVVLCGDFQEAASKIFYVINLPSEDLRRGLELYQEGNFHDPFVGAKALVFYRRHSFFLKPHLTAEEVNFYESMSNFLVCVLRRANYSVNRDFS